jgi:hypothetical protein
MVVTTWLSPHPSPGDLYDVIDMYEAEAASAQGRRVMPRSARVGPKAFDDMAPLELAQVGTFFLGCSPGPGCFGPILKAAHPNRVGRGGW